MACLSSTVLACTLYSAQHRQQRRRRIVSCAISILYLATLARQGAVTPRTRRIVTSCHYSSENISSRDIYSVNCAVVVPTHLSRPEGWGWGAAMRCVQCGEQGCGDPMWRVMCCEWVLEITYISEAFHKSQKHFWVTLQYWVTIVSIVLVFWNVKQVCWAGLGRADWENVAVMHLMVMVSLLLCHLSIGGKRNDCNRYVRICCPVSACPVWPGAGTRFTAGTGFRVMKPNTRQPGPAPSVVCPVSQWEYLEYVNLAGQVSEQCLECCDCVIV